MNVPLDGLAVLTVVSKWMGSLSEWAPYLVEAKERGYNMLHYTPLQLRGESKSPYSIADQLAFDDALFESGWKGTPEQGVELVKAQLKECKEKYGLLSLTDVVLNHTANNSLWLHEHPEAGSFALYVLLVNLPTDYTLFVRIQSFQFTSPYSSFRT